MNSYNRILYLVFKYKSFCARDIFAGYKVPVLLDSKNHDKVYIGKQSKGFRSGVLYHRKSFRRKTSNRQEKK